MVDGLSTVDDDIYTITRVMYAYCWALDHRDWDRLEACFTDDVVFEASNMGRYEGYQSLLEAFQTRTIRVPIRRHLIGNPYVQVSGDTAEFTSNLMNIRVRAGAPGGDFFIAGGHYRNSLVRTDKGWRIAHLRWEAQFVEGNTRLDPTIPLSDYLHVMASPKEATWGGASVREKDGRSASQQIKDLSIGLFRAIDAGADKDARAALAADACVMVDGRDAALTSDVMTAFGAIGGGWVQHFFFNEKVAVAGEEARYCAYVYRIENRGLPANIHTGGVLMISARRLNRDWRISEIEYIPFWQRGQEINSDLIRTRPDYRKITAFGWGLEDRRERLRNEDEIADLIVKYTWRYDFWDFDRVGECFTDDVEGTFTTASTTRFSGRCSMVPGIQQGHELQPYMQHYVTNIIVNMGADGASAEMKCYATTRRTEAGGGHVSMAGGRYQGYAQLHRGEWRFVVFEYSRVHAAYDGETS